MRTTRRKFFETSVVPLASLTQIFAQDLELVPNAVIFPRTYFPYLPNDIATQLIGLQNQPINQVRHKCNTAWKNITIQLFVLPLFHGLDSISDHYLNLLPKGSNQSQLSIVKMKQIDQTGYGCHSLSNYIALMQTS